MLKHVKEVRIVIDVCVGVHTDEVGSSTDPGRRTVRQSENVSAVPTRTAINAGNVETRRAKVSSSPSALTLGAEGLEDLVPALGGLETGDAWGRIIAGGVDDSVLRQNGDPPSVPRRSSDTVVCAAMGSFARNTRTLDVGAHASLVAPMERASGVSGNGLPGRVGMTSLLESNSSGIVVVSKSGNGGPVGLKTRYIEANEVDILSWAVSISGTGIGSSATVAKRA